MRSMAHLTELNPGRLGQPNGVSRIGESDAEKKNL